VTGTAGAQSQVTCKVTEGVTSSSLKADRHISLENISLFRIALLQETVLKEAQLK